MLVFKYIPYHQLANLSKGGKLTMAIQGETLNQKFLPGWEFTFTVYLSVKKAETVISN